MTKSMSKDRRTELSIAFAIAFAGACAMGALAMVVPAHAATTAKTTAAATAPMATDPEPVAPAAATPTSSLERIKATGKITFGYRADTAPMSYRDAAGRPAGYSVTLCNRVADAMKRDLGAAPLSVEWIEVGSGFSDVETHRVDMICAGDEVTQASRAQVSFSIPVFPGGVSALVRSDANKSLQEALEERPKPYELLWRGTPPPTLAHRTYSALVGTATMEGLLQRMVELRLTANVEPVADYDAGIAALLKGRTDVLFGERVKLLQAVQRSPSRQDLRVLTRHFTFVALALAVPRNDDDFRLAVDRALSEVYADPKFGALYTAEFGTPDADTVAFFRSVGVPASSPVGPTQ